MFGLGIQECFLLFCLALLIFGPRWFEKSFLSVKDSFSDFGRSLKEAKESDPKALPGPTREMSESVDKAST